MAVERMDNVGIVVEDLEATIEFFRELGLELEEPHTEGQLLVRALDPELVWLAHAHEPWRPAPSTA